MLWIKEQLLQKLEKPSIIVIEEWLNTYNIIAYKQSMLIVIYFLGMKKKSYKVDELVEKYGHKVLRMSPYYCVFNSTHATWVCEKKLCRQVLQNSGFILLGI